MSMNAISDIRIDETFMILIEKVALDKLLKNQSGKLIIMPCNTASHVSFNIRLAVGEKTIIHELFAT